MPPNSRTTRQLSTTLPDPGHVHEEELEQAFWSGASDALEVCCDAQELARLQPDEQRAVAMHVIDHFRAYLAVFCRTGKSVNKPLDSFDVFAGRIKKAGEWKHRINSKILSIPNTNRRDACLAIAANILAKVKQIQSGETDKE